jgi:hypothetical protein
MAKIMIFNYEKEAIWAPINLFDLGSYFLKTLVIRCFGFRDSSRIYPNDKGQHLFPWYFPSEENCGNHKKIRAVINKSKFICECC